MICLAVPSYQFNSKVIMSLQDNFKRKFWYSFKKTWPHSVVKTAMYTDV